MRFRRISTIAAVAVAATVASATPALAVSTYGGCSQGGNHFEFAINWVPSGTSTLIQSYAYKIYGTTMRNKNNVHIEVRYAGGGTVPGSRRNFDEIPETRPDAWTTYDIADIRLPASGSYQGWGEAIFDIPGFDSRCADLTAAFG